MKQSNPTYTDAMDRLVLLTVGTICVESPSGSGQVALLLGLLRKLVQGCLELAGDEASGETVSGYTWEEKIENLVKLAKVAGRYINSREGTDYNEEAMFNLREAYDEFCEWRHDEPYVVDEIRALLQQAQEESNGQILSQGK